MDALLLICIVSLECVVSAVVTLLRYNSAVVPSFHVRSSMYNDTN